MVLKPDCLKTAIVVFGGFLVHLALGSFFTFGNFAPYFISYIRNRTEDTSVRNINGLWITSFGSLGNCVGFPLGGLLDHRFGPRVATSLGGLVFSVSVFACYFCVKQSLLAMVFVYGVTSHIGNFMAYGPPIQNVIRWMPTHPALATGLIVAGFGGGATIFNQVITAYINPDNLSPELITEDGDRVPIPRDFLLSEWGRKPIQKDRSIHNEDLLNRVPTMFLILGGTYLAMIAIGVACLSEPQSNTEEVEIGNEKDTSKSNDLKTGNAVDILTVSKVVTDGSPVDSHNFQEELTIIEAIKLAFRTRSFYLVGLIILVTCCGMQFVFTLYKAYGQTFIEDDHFLSLVGSLSSIFNCIGRPAWGAFMDKFGYRVTIQCLSVGLASLSGTLSLTEHMPKELFAVWICVLFFFFCGLWSTTPTTLAKLFGPKNMAINYGFINFAVAVGGLTAGIAGMTLKSKIGWHGLYYMSSGLAAAPFLLSFFFDGRDRDGKRI